MISSSVSTTHLSTVRLRRKTVQIRGIATAKINMDSCSLVITLEEKICTQLWLLLYQSTKLSRKVPGAVRFLSKMCVSLISEIKRLPAKPSKPFFRGIRMLQTRSLCTSSQVANLLTWTKSLLFGSRMPLGVGRTYLTVVSGPVQLQKILF